MTDPWFSWPLSVLSLLAVVAGAAVGAALRRRRRHSGGGGWQEAVRLYVALAAGQRPPRVFAPDLPAGGAFYLDVPFGYARYFAVKVTCQPGGMLAVGSPGFVAGAAVGRLIGVSIGYARAAALSRRQWHGHRVARVVVTASSTWCGVGGRWLRFDHTAVTDFRLVGAQTCVITFADAVPLRLSGPSAACYAVLFAYLRHGPPAWQAAPFLHPLRRAATTAFGRTDAVR